ncbi:MAG: FKBP-type peptidyl-prolyl cis-trans isomerase [Cyclobacteriaceae bacterium]
MSDVMHGMSIGKFPLLLCLLFSVVLISCNQGNEDPVNPGEPPTFSELAAMFLDSVAVNYDVVTFSDEQEYFQYLISDDSPGGSGAAGSIASITYQYSLLSYVDSVFQSDTILTYSSSDTLLLHQGMNAVYPIGLDHAIGYMAAGQEWGVILPPDLAYADLAFTTIPENSIVHFQIEVIEVKSSSEIQDEETLAINQYMINSSLNDTTVLTGIAGLPPVYEPNGLIFRILGDTTLTPRPLPGDSVQLTYQWSYLDSTNLNLTYANVPQVLQYRGDSNPLILGLDQAIGMLREGERARVIIPSLLAYAESAVVIPSFIKSEVFENKIIPEYATKVEAYKTLVFEAELRRILR